MNKNWIIWTGVMRTDLASETKGQINVTDVFPDAGGRVDGWVNGITDWYTALPPRLQDRYMDQYNRLVQGLQDIQNGVEDGTIRYQMQKVIPKPWNLLLGVQYQSSNRWQFRAEWQTLGDRDGVLLSANYRFGIKGKTWFGH